MAIGLPVKANYAAGDILTATNMNDLSGTFNNVATSYGNAAGKNKIINGDFGVWQRGTSFTAAGYNSDRWSYGTSSATGSTISRQTFTPGTAPVAGYEGSYFFRYARTSGTTTYNFLLQNVEDVRNFAGQTAIYSFWAKADAATTVTVSPAQIFGNGGSSPVDLTTSGSLSLTTSWQRFSYSFAVPSIAGKTVGTDSCFKIQINFGTGNKTIDLWGAQLEAGSMVTPFATASGGSIQSELAMCQRYYWRQSFTGTFYPGLGMGSATSTTNAAIIVVNPVTMRVIPTSIDFSGLAIYDGTNVLAVSATSFNSAGNTAVTLDCTTTGATQYRPYRLWINSNNTGFLGFSAEL